MNQFPRIGGVVRCSGVIVSALDPDRGVGVVFLGKTLESHSASLHQGVTMATGRRIKCGRGGGGEERACDGLAPHPKRDQTTPIRFILQTPDVYFLSCFVLNITL